MPKFFEEKPPSFVKEIALSDSDESSEVNKTPPNQLSRPRRTRGLRGPEMTSCIQRELDHIKTKGGAQSMPPPEHPSTLPKP